MEAEKLRFDQRVGLETLWFAARLFAMMPYWFKYYVVENFIFFLLYRCLRYRRKVVTTNLRNAFPEKSEAERAAIRRNFYRTLSEVIVDTLNMAHMSPAKARSVICIGDLEAHLASVGDRDWIAMMAHFGCWEYGAYWGIYAPSQLLVAVYHPLHSKVVDAFYRRLRNSEHATTVAMKESLRFYLRHRETGIGGKRLVMGLIADQSPRRRPDSHWFRFLNQDTIFSTGANASRCGVIYRSISCAWSGCGAGATACRSN